MNDLENNVLSILRDFGGESSVFLITNPDSPWGKLSDSNSLLEAVKSLNAKGLVVHNPADDSVTIA